MIPSPEQQSKIAEWSAKSLAGTLTLEEMREAIKFMRQGRRTASEPAKKSGSKAKGPVRSADDLLSELGPLGGL